MNTVLTNAARVTGRALPASAAAALAALSVGAVAGYAARTSFPAHSKPGFSLRARPTLATVRAGSVARYRITIRRHSFAGRVTLTMSTRIPSGATARFSPARTRRSSSTLTILTSSHMAVGRYRIHLRARAGKLTRSIWIKLSIVASAGGLGTATGAGTGTGGRSATGTGTATGNVALSPFAITGDFQGPLEPGSPRAIDLQITNPNASPLVVTALTASVRAVSSPQATASLPCPPSDFSMRQFSGHLPLTVPASSTRSLAELGIPAAQWPEVSLIDLSTNQNGCQAASLTLAYAGVATAG
jgi:hypothetical protein